MIVCGLDIGGASTNGICLMNEHEEIIKLIEVPYKSKTKGDHRRYVASLVRETVIENKANVILMEAVRSFRGGQRSPLADVMSLGKLTGALIDSCHDVCEIYQIQVNTWKSRILGNRSATKNDAIELVKRKYNLDVCHDVADSICIALCAIRYRNVIEGENNRMTNK